MDLSSISDSDLRAIAGQGALASVSSAILGQESGNNPNIGSSIDGAIGQAQILPKTFAQYAQPGEDINNPSDNLAVHNRIIQDLSQKAGGDPARIAVGYFSGPGNIAPPDSPTPWKKDRTDGNGKSVSSYVSDVLGRVGNSIVPSANAAESQDLSKISDEQLLSIANGQTDYSGLGAKPWSALHIQSQELPEIRPDINQNALSAVSTSIPAALTAYGANYISGIPGLKETGSALAALANQGQGKTFGERYNNLEEAQAAMRNAGEQNNPGATTLGNISGLITGLGLGGKAFGELMPESSSALTAYAKAHPYIAGMGVNGALGALYGGADGTDIASRASGAARGGILNSLLSVPLTYGANNILGPLAGKLIGSMGEVNAPLLGADLGKSVDATTISGTPIVSNALQKDIIKTPETAEQMGALANGAYKKADELGGTISPKGTNRVLEIADKTMPQTKAGKLIFGDSETTKLVERLQSLKDKPLSLAEAQEVDEALSDAIDGHTQLGKIDKQGIKIGKIQSALRDIMHNPSEGDTLGGTAGFDALQQGRAYWMQTMKMRDLEQIQRNAALMDVPATSIRSGIRAILKNPNKAKFYSPDEISSLKKAASAGILGEALRGIGSRLTQYAAGGAGLATGGPIGGAASWAAAHAVSGVARNAAETLQNARVNSALETIAKNTKPKVRK